MVILRSLLLFILCFSPEKALTASKKCLSALDSLFPEEITADKAGEFLKLQGEITLHRLAWAYLKNQKESPQEKVLSVERSIIELLNDKYTNSDPDFIAARNAYEAQPLSRSALADIAPYLKEALASSYEDKDKNFILNQSDLKLLGSIAKHERASAEKGTFDHRMLDARSPQGILNFIKIINSSYKISPSLTDEELDIELKLKGLENVMSNMQSRLNSFLDNISVPAACSTDPECETSMSELFDLNEEIQKIFWEGLADKIESDDILVQRMSYGDLWLQVKTKNYPRSISKEIEKLPTTKSKPLPITSDEPYSEKLPLPNLEASITPALISHPDELIIEDPMSIIFKDLKKSNIKTLKDSDRSFQLSMAAAILADQKVFQYGEKIYDRKTGQEIAALDAISFMPPDRKEEVEVIIESADSGIKTPLSVALINNQKTFVSGQKLYDLKGKSLNPGLVIANVMTKKTGVKHEASRFNDKDNEYLVSRARALSNNDPFFKAGKSTMDSLTGLDLSSPFRGIASTDAKIEKKKRILFENLSDAELIRNFHRSHPNPDCGHYGMIDKQSAMFKIFNNAGNEVFTTETLIGAEVSDMRTRWTEYSPTQRTSSNSTGAGIFTIRSQDLNDSYNKLNFNNNILSLKDENENDSVFAIHQVPKGLEARYARFETENPEDRRVSGGCANLRLADFIAIKKLLGPVCKVYVLPEEEGHKFVMRDNELKLISTKSIPINKTNFYNFSSIDGAPTPININIVNKAGDTQQAREYIKALEDEKPTLMKMYHLTNDEYNDLALLAYGVLGNESKFGKSHKLKLKENAQFAIIAARLLKKQNMDFALNTSRGLTQIKFLPEGPFEENYPEITKNNLMNPRNSAVATMGYLAEASKQMRQIAIKNKSDPAKLHITRENMMDFMGYLYQGRRSSLTTADPEKQATPELNFYYRNLQRHMSYIEISQRIE